MYDFFGMLKRCLENYLDLINIISQTIKYEYHEPNQLLFRTGDKGENFYVIFKGLVNIMVAKDVKMVMTEEEYIQYLERLSKNEEYFILNNCLNANRKVINVDTSNPTGKKIIKRQSKIKEKLRVSAILTYEVNKNEKSQEKSFDADHLEYIERLKPVHNLDKVTKDSKLFEVKVWQYFHVLTLKAGSYFGDTALISNDQRR
jgi:CRP-like cAMP-binding protein